MIFGCLLVGFTCIRKMINEIDVQRSYRQEEFLWKKYLILNNFGIEKVLVPCI